MSEVVGDIGGYGKEESRRSLTWARASDSKRSLQTLNTLFDKKDLPSQHVKYRVYLLT